ncbi:uncharacterized protein LOC144925548 isoform X2 [Branchiostoma floridae x Branchiostoma belcheri]
MEEDSGEFPGLYNRENDFTEEDMEPDHDEEEEKESLKKKEKHKKDKAPGYVAFEEEDSDEESPSKGKRKGLFRNRFSQNSKRKFKDKERDKDKDKEKEKAKEKEKEKKEEKSHHKEKEKEKKKSSSLPRDLTPDILRSYSFKEKSGRKKEAKEAKSPSQAQALSADELSSPAREPPQPIFGIPLHEAVERSKLIDGIELPAIFRDCLDFIEERGLCTEGIYRISPVKSQVDALRAAYDHGEVVDLQDHDPHTVAGLLKTYLRELPDPVLTMELLPGFEDASALAGEDDRVAALIQMLYQLPTCNRLLITWLIQHMVHIMDREAETKMNLQNISIVLSPTLNISHRVLNAFFSHHDQLFGDDGIRKVGRPLRWESSTMNLDEIPDSPSSIEEELQRQEALLEQLHSELGAGVEDPEKEERLWEVQRIITQLKRQLKRAKTTYATAKTSTKQKEKETRQPETKAKVTETKEPETKPTATEKTAEEKPGEKKLAEKKSGEKKGAEKKPADKKLADKKSVDAEKQKEKETKEEVEDKKVAKPSDQEVETKKETEDQVEKEEAAGVETSAVHQQEEEEAGEGRMEEQEEEGEDDELELLLEEEAALIAEQEELLALQGNLQSRIEKERTEIDQLKEELAEAMNSRETASPPQQNGMRSSSSSSSSNSSVNSSDSSSEDEEELQDILDDLVKENQELETKNSDLSLAIDRERQRCVQLKVQIRMLQRREQLGSGEDGQQTDSSAPRTVTVDRETTL